MPRPKETTMTLLPRTWKPAFSTLLTACAVLLPVLQAEAVTVRYDYALEITKIKTSDASVVSPFNASDKVQVLGSFTIDTEAEDRRAGNDGIGLYNAGVLNSAFSFSWGNGNSYSSGIAAETKYVSQIRNLTDTTGDDRYRFQDRSSYADLGDYSFAFLRINLLDKANADVFSDDSMPVEIDANAFNRRKFVLRFKDGTETLTYKGNVIAWQSAQLSSAAAVASVPLPGSLSVLLGGLGLGACVLGRRKRNT